MKYASVLVSFVGIVYGLFLHQAYGYMAEESSISRETDEYQNDLSVAKESDISIDMPKGPHIEEFSKNWIEGDENLLLNIFQGKEIDCDDFNHSLEETEEKEKICGWRKRRAAFGNTHDQSIMHGPQGPMTYSSWPYNNRANGFSDLPEANQFFGASGGAASQRFPHSQSIREYRGTQGPSGWGWRDGQPGTAGIPGSPGMGWQNGQNVTPGQPGFPGLEPHGSQPGTPGTPGAPGGQEFPAPGFPDTGTQNGQPGKPGTSGKPGGHGQNGRPGTPGTPGAPEGQGFPAPGFPDTGTQNGQPGKPGTPGAPGGQGTPGSGSSTGKPEAPGSPSFPERPGFPETGSQNGQPGIPGTPGTPGGQGFPGSGSQYGQQGTPGVAGGLTDSELDCIRAGYPAIHGTPGYPGRRGQAGQEGQRGYCGGTPGTPGKPGPGYIRNQARKY